MNINTFFCKYSIAIIWIGCLDLPLSGHQDKNCCFDCKFTLMIQSYAIKTPWNSKQRFVADVIQIFQRNKSEVVTLILLWLLV